MKVSQQQVLDNNSTSSQGTRVTQFCMTPTFKNKQKRKSKSHETTANLTTRISYFVLRNHKFDGFNEPPFNRCYVAVEQRSPEE